MLFFTQDFTKLALVLNKTAINNLNVVFINRFEYMLNNPTYLLMIRYIMTCLIYVNTRLICKEKKFIITYYMQEVSQDLLPIIFKAGVFNKWK